jgi:threonine dehydratase
MKKPLLTVHQVLEARARLDGAIRRTPSVYARALSERTGARTWLKRDDLQRTGSFKERGARHALLSLPVSARSRGVVAASAGNHALGLAFHGGMLGIRVTVVMPATAPDVKINRCRALGAEVVLHGQQFQEAQAFAGALARETGATYLHPFDDLSVIAGQGTLALEVLEQVRNLDTIVVPVGGGGLLAGVATVIKALRPQVRVIAVEPENAASFLAACVYGAPRPAMVSTTLADGLAVTEAGRLTFAIAAPRIDDLVTVSESEIAQAIGVLARDEGVIAEGAGAVGVAALLAGKLSGRVVVLPVGGRNIDARIHERIVARQSEPTSSWPCAA